MSDSDSDCLSTNKQLCGFPRRNAVVNVRGPKIDYSMNMNIEHNSRYLPRNFDRHQMYESRRDISPVSMRSTSEYQQPRNFHQSFYPGQIPQNSMMYGRARSPTLSIRSMDSNASRISAADIVAALNSTKFNKYELLNMSQAFQKLVKGKSRKRRARKRNIKLFLKGGRRRSGGDSGEQGSSSSSLSSDDCQSVRSGLTVHNMPGYMRYQPSSGRISDDAQSAKTDTTELRRTIRDNSIYHDRNDNFKTNSYNNFYHAPKNANHSRISSVHSSFIAPKPKNVVLQKDRFKNSFLLPSQRFNRSILPSVEEKCERNHEKSYRTLNNMKYARVRDFNTKSKSSMQVSDDEEIFNNLTLDKSMMRKPQRKRSLSQENKLCSESKRTKLALDKINNTEFVFAKPVMPPKVTKAKTKQAHPIPDDIHKDQRSNDTSLKNTNIQPPSNKQIDEDPEKNQISLDNVPVTRKSPRITKHKKQITAATEIEKPLLQKQPQINGNDTIDPCESSIYSASNVSMRPSFLKRKLFTQTLDMTENKNSNDSLSSSPHVENQKEKSRTRKLVSNTAYLSRDVTKDDNNLIDLIHKIVPPDKINMTTNRSETTIRTDIQSQTVQSKNNLNLTDSITTDDDIFNMDATSKNNEALQKNKNLKTNFMDCTVVLNDLKAQKPATKTVPKENITTAPVSVQRSVQSNVHQFWNCSDSEIDDFDHRKSTALPKNMTSSAYSNPVNLTECTVSNAKPVSQTNTTKNATTSKKSTSVSVKIQSTNILKESNNLLNKSCPKVKNHDKKKSETKCKEKAAIVNEKVKAKITNDENKKNDKNTVHNNDTTQAEAKNKETANQNENVKKDSKQKNINATKRKNVSSFDLNASICTRRRVYYFSATQNDTNKTVNQSQTTKTTSKTKKESSNVKNKTNNNKLKDSNTQIEQTDKQNQHNKYSADIAKNDVKNINDAKKKPTYADLNLTGLPKNATKIDLNASMTTRRRVYFYKTFDKKSKAQNTTNIVIDETQNKEVKNKTRRQNETKKVANKKNDLAKENKNPNESMCTRNRFYQKPTIGGKHNIMEAVEKLDARVKKNVTEMPPPARTLASVINNYVKSSRTTDSKVDSGIFIESVGESVKKRRTCRLRLDTLNIT